VTTRDLNTDRWNGPIRVDLQRDQAGIVEDRSADVMDILASAPSRRSHEKLTVKRRSGKLLPKSLSLCESIA